MLLRDPVHGLVRFEGAAEPLITRLLATREVQRLRRVHQLGLAALVFPGAEHSRFSHAVGTAFVMQRWLARMRVVQSVLPVEEHLDEEAELEALAAALLHDLGHGPFSHLFEDVLPNARTHEAWTGVLLRDPETDTHRALESLSRGMAERVAGLLEGRHRVSYLPAIISGTLDVDRCDYLLRDSHMTGVRYGLYDLDWLIQALTLGRLTTTTGEERSVLVVEGRKGLPPIESFFQARSFMYQQVYHHKAVRAAESLMRSLFLRLRMLSEQGDLPGTLPEGLAATFDGRAVTVGSFLELDDAVLTASLAAFRSARDPMLGRLASGFLERHLPKTLPLPEDAPDAENLWRACHERAREVARAQGWDPDLSVWLDVPSDVPYKESEGDAPEGLWVWLRHRPMARLGDVSFLLRQLRNKRLVRPRLVFPAELREDVSASVEGLLT